MCIQYISFVNITYKLQHIGQYIACLYFKCIVYNTFFCTILYNDCTIYLQLFDSVFDSVS